jgi:pimeloyl-ACP methyl ester carboxylesterase
MDGTGELLRTQTAGLEKAFDVRCLAIPVDDLSSWEVLTEQVVQLIQAELDKTSIARPVYLCGESFGGCLALRVATLAPHLFTQILLVNPASSFQDRYWMVWGGQVIRFFPKLLYQTSSVVLLPFLAALERISPDDRQSLLKAVQSVPKVTSLWRLSLLAEFDVNALHLERLRQPLLILASGSDRLLPSVEEAQNLVRKLPHAQLVILPDSGHACLLEADVNLYQIMEQQNFLVRQFVEH